jgi:hypothetical protein
MIAPDDLSSIADPPIGQKAPQGVTSGSAQLHASLAAFDGYGSSGGRSATSVLYVVAMAGVMAAVDVLFFRDHVAAARP